jgi:hypothetical protein
MEAEVALGQGLGEKGEQLAPEQAAENVDGQEEFWPAGNPSRAVQGQPSGRNQAMPSSAPKNRLKPPGNGARLRPIPHAESALHPPNKNVNKFAFRRA